MKNKALLSVIFMTSFLVSNLFVIPAFTLPTSGMVSYWKLDESSGTTAYDSVGANDGTLVNGPFWTTGVVGGALSFDGINDYVEIPHSNNLDITNNLTVEFWFKTNTVNRDGLISKYWSSGTADRCWMIYLTKHGDDPTVSPRIGTCIYDGGGTLNDFALTFGQTDIQIDTWYHVAFIVSGSDVKMWLNGNLDAHKTLINPGIQSRVVPVEIGRWNKGIDTRYYFDGLIDEVAIYNRVLTEVEIQRHYNNGLRGFGIHAPPIPTSFYMESDQVDDDLKFARVAGNLVIIKAISYHDILSGGDVEGTVTLNVVLRIDTQIDEATFSGSFLITATDGSTIHGRVNAKIIDYSTDYVVQGTFQGGGYMNIRGTLSTLNTPGWQYPLVWDGVSW